jgi:hypothetical protein
MAASPFTDDQVARLTAAVRHVALLNLADGGRNAATGLHEADDANGVTFVQSAPKQVVDLVVLVEEHAEALEAAIAAYHADASSRASNLLDEIADRDAIIALLRGP